MQSLRCHLSMMLWVSLTLLQSSCTFYESSPELQISSKPVPAEPPAKGDDYISRLHYVVGDNAKRKAVTQDVEWGMKAQIHEERGEWDLAVQSWLALTKSSEYFLSKRAFEGLTKSYSHLAGENFDPQQLADVILQETNQGQKGAFLVNRRLADKQRLTAEIQTLLVRRQETLVNIELPVKGLPTSDPLLDKNALAYCNAGTESRARWAQWEKSLDKGLADFWRAKVASCERNYEKAIVLYKQAFSQLLRKPATATLAVNAAEGLVAMYRATGMRDAVAESYVILSKAFNRVGVSSEQYGESEVEFMLRRVNIELWAARYQAMLGQYDEAKQFTQTALSRLETLTGQDRLPNKTRDQIRDLKAEAYHVLAFRIAVEEGNYQDAIAFNRLGQQIPGLTTEWKTRFNWHGGLYEYLAGNLSGAVSVWEAMLKEKNDMTTKAQLVFWLARSYDGLNNQDKKEALLDRLRQEHTLSFYNIVATKLAGLNAKKSLSEIFGPADKLAEELENKRQFKVNKLKKNQRLAELLLRAEVLVAADSGEWGRLAVRNLIQEVRKQFRVGGNREMYTYLSRLAYQAGEYSSALTLTDDLWGEESRILKEEQLDQLFVYYPRPYANMYEEYGQAHNVQREILYAVTRQESRFNAQAVSPAGAYGLMQLMPHTARRFGQEYHLDISKPEVQLTDPETNIKLSAAYVRFLLEHYSGDLPSMAAAYNAGEFVVDAWLKNRKQNDPLIWIEMIPFGETKTYVRNVLRNYYVYQYLAEAGGGRPAVKLSLD